MGRSEFNLIDLELVYIFNILILVLTGIFCISAVYRNKSFFWPLLIIGGIFGTGPRIFIYLFLDEWIILCTLFGSFLNILKYHKFNYWTFIKQGLFKSNFLNNKFNKIHFYMFLIWILYMIIESVIGIFVNQDWRIIKWVIFFMTLLIISCVALETENYFQFPSLLSISRIISVSSSILFLTYFLQGVYFEDFFERNSGRYLSQDFFWSGSAYAVFPTLISLPAALISLKLEKDKIFRLISWITIVTMMLVYFYFESRIGWLAFLGIILTFLIRFTKKELIYSSKLLIKLSCIFFTGFLIFKTEVPNIISLTFQNNIKQYSSWSDTYAQAISKKSINESNLKEAEKISKNKKILTDQINKLEILSQKSSKGSVSKEIVILLKNNKILSDKIKKTEMFIKLENQDADYKFELSKFRNLLIKIIGKDWGPDLKKEEAFKQIYLQEKKIKLIKIKAEIYRLHLKKIYLNEKETQLDKNILILTKKFENLKNENMPSIFKTYKPNQMIDMVNFVKSEIDKSYQINEEYEDWKKSKDYSIKTFDKIIKTFDLVKEETKDKNFGYWRDLVNASAVLVNPEGSDLNRQLQFYAGFLRILDNPVTFLIGDGVYSHRYTMLPIIKELYKKNDDKMTESLIKGTRDDLHEDIKVFRTTGFTSLLIDTGVLGMVLFVTLFFFIVYSLFYEEKNNSFLNEIIFNHKLRLFAVLILINFAWFLPINITDNSLSYLLLMPNGILFRWYKFYSMDDNHE